VQTNSYYDADEFAEQAAKPMRATFVTSHGRLTALLPPCATEDDLLRIRDAAQRTRALEVNGGFGQRS
jgi:hypothetical protein